MTIERPTFPAAAAARLTAEKSCVAGCILATRRADHFLDLETPMRNLGAMVAIVMAIWRDRAVVPAGLKHSDLMDVALDQLELMAQTHVDDYRAKLEETPRRDKAVRS